MSHRICSETGSYVLLINMDADTTVQIGKLGLFSFEAGYYLYSGSALSGLSARVNRHLRQAKKDHWHIDYLLRHSEIIDVWCALSQERLECLLAQASFELPQAGMPIRGFGSSDCSCYTHLAHVPRKPSMADMQARVDFTCPNQGIRLTPFSRRHRR